MSSLPPDMPPADGVPPSSGPSPAVQSFMQNLMQNANVPAKVKAPLHFHKGFHSHGKKKGAIPDPPAGSNTPPSGGIQGQGI